MVRHSDALPSLMGQLATRLTTLSGALSPSTHTDRYTPPLTHDKGGRGATGPPRASKGLGQGSFMDGCLTAVITTGLTGGVALPKGGNGDSGRQRAATWVSLRAIISRIS